MCLVTQPCQARCDPVDCGPPGSSVRGTLQARTLEGSPRPPPGGLSNTGLETTSPVSPAWQADSLPAEPEASTRDDSNAQQGLEKIGLRRLKQRYSKQPSVVNSKSKLHCRPDEKHEPVLSASKYTVLWFVPQRRFPGMPRKGHLQTS